MESRSRQEVCRVSIRRKALHSSRQRNRTGKGIVEVCLNRASVLSTIDSGFASLHQAAVNDHVEIISAPLKHADRADTLGQLLEARDEYDPSALHWAGVPSILKKIPLSTDADDAFLTALCRIARRAAAGDVSAQEERALQQGPALHRAPLRDGLDHLIGPAVDRETLRCRCRWRSHSQSQAASS